MQKRLLFATALFLLCFNANSQITKGNWLLGGNLNFSASRYKSDFGSKNDAYDFKISPNVGYFVADKFATGLKTSIGLSGVKGTGTGKFGTYADYNFGPFARYYFLPVDKQFNLLAEGYYQYGFFGGSGIKHISKSTFGVQAGPEVFFNSSVGLELLIGYRTLKNNGYSGMNNSILFSLGFQIHLEKDK